MTGRETTLGTVFLELKSVNVQEQSPFPFVSVVSRRVVGTDDQTC